jgi:hypothetical protein
MQKTKVQTLYRLMCPIYDLVLQSCQRLKRRHVFVLPISLVCGDVGFKIDKKNKKFATFEPKKV